MYWRWWGGGEGAVSTSFEVSRWVMGTSSIILEYKLNIYLVGKVIYQKLNNCAEHSKHGVLVGGGGIGTITQYHKI